MQFSKLKSQDNRILFASLGDQVFPCTLYTEINYNFSGIKYQSTDILTISQHYQQNL